MVVRDDTALQTLLPLITPSTPCGDKLKHVLEHWLMQEKTVTRPWALQGITISAALKPLNSRFSITGLLIQGIYAVILCSITASHTVGYFLYPGFSSSVKKMCSLRERKVPVWDFSLFFFCLNDIITKRKITACFSKWCFIKKKKKKEKRKLLRSRLILCHDSPFIPN